MRKMKYTKATIVTASLITLILLVAPSVFAGSFQIIIPPLDEVVRPGLDMKNVTGFTKNTPGPTDFFRGLWFNSFTEITVAEKPDWATITIPESTILTPPDGQKYYFDILIAVNEDAPAYEWANVKLNIVTGKFMRIVFPNIPILNQEFPLDQSFAIRAGYLPLIGATNPEPKEGIPNSFINHKIKLVNNGNARSLFSFIPDYAAIPDGWSVTAPAQVYLNKDEEFEVPVAVYTPSNFGYIDEWASIPIKINMQSVVDPSGDTQESTVFVTSHCVGYYAPVPGGNNPTMLFASIIGIIIVIIVLIIFAIRIIKNQAIFKKIKDRRQKKE